ncbi:hypothetical protein M3N64_10150 [Sporolactobacillus sp. CPB3-1]|uniref:Uncharacterized protein n=1 Tax=Sporolactobacillus mangiferae TaxID=2940498 RepID=A0ABT0MDG1_9BACL|nr:hypothetical protein [Sporolactobacillus mangiferae]MCL1632299.1 hypothetical protein [Sporolactobacillus mangiferae]
MHSNNPAAAALMSKMNVPKQERVQVRLAFIRQMIAMHMDAAQERMINGFFETYLQLTDKEVDQLMTEAKKLPEEIREEALKWPNSFYEKGSVTTAKKIARKLKERGMSVAEISELTELSEEEIHAIESGEFGE